MRKNFTIVLISLILLAGTIFILAGGNKKEGEAESTIEDSVDALAQFKERPNIEAFGLIKATEVMSINIGFPARISKLFVQEGQKVTLGEALLSLDVDDYRTEIRNTEYELNMARFELEKEKKTLKQLEYDIKEKEEQLRNSSDYEIKKVLSDLAKAEEELRTKKELLSVAAVPKSEILELEKVVSDLKLSLDHLRYEKTEEIRKLHDELELKKRSTANNNPYHTSVEMHKAKISLLEQKLNAMRKQINQSFIRNDQIISKFQNGVVCNINYAEGDLPIIEKTVLSIINLDSLVIKANVAEEFIKDIKTGAEVLITPVADYSREYKGKIIRISDLAVEDNGETVIPVEISIDNRDEFLLPNFNVDVKIYIDSPAGD